MQFSRRNVIGLAASAVLAVFAAGPTFAKDRLQVVATTGMIADAARQIGGDFVEVKALMGPGVDPHAYRQTRTDIVALTRADLVLWHGLYLEAQMEDFFHKLESRRNVVAVAEGLARENLITHPVYADKVDPHVWMAPEMWRSVVEQVSAALVEAMPEQADYFAANADHHIAQVGRLHGYASKVLSSIPENSRILVSAHDAFGYFGRAYGFEVLGIQGISTESEAGLNRIGELVDILVERKVGAVFVESSVSDRNIRALIEGAAARGHKVVIGGELYSDAMGVEGTYEGTYLGMIDHNVTVIAGALGGEVPERGMDGKLQAGF